MTPAPPLATPASDASAAAAPELARFAALLRQSLTDASFVKLALSQHRGADTSLQRVLARRVLLRGQDSLSLTLRHATQDITKNLGLDAATAQIEAWLTSDFGHAHLHTRSHDVQLARTRKGGWQLRVGKLAADADADAASAAPVSHDQPKHHALSLSAPFLTALGLTDAQQRLVPAMARKWRQINKFVEVLAHALDESPLRDAKTLRVLDFGAGKGYLTFAVQQCLAARGVAAHTTGVELRPELTALCNGLARQLGLDRLNGPGSSPGLDFVAGDIASHPAEPVDIMIALHACDTATDLAMHRGVASGAAIIVCSPCCHKELRPQMHAPELLAPLLRHGIHMTAQAEMLTDGLRALLLQAQGYDTQVFEFISPEHTGKNKMVLALKRAQPLPEQQRQRILAQIAALKTAFGVHSQALERLLAGDAAPTPIPCAPAQAEETCP